MRDRDCRDGWEGSKSVFQVCPDLVPSVSDFFSSSQLCLVKDPLSCLLVIAEDPLPPVFGLGGRFSKIAHVGLEISETILPFTLSVSPGQQVIRKIHDKCVTG